LELKNSVVAVTGASSGIGREIALQLSREGARMLLVARQTKLLQEVAEEARHLGGQAAVATIDLSVSGGPESVVESAVREFGSIDVLVNNAGATVFGPFDEAEPDSIRRVISINLEAPVLACRAAIPHFKRNGKGAIVNIASLAAFATPAWLATYAITKAGVLALSRNLRFELRPYGVRVVGVYPGDVDTTFADTAQMTKTAEPMRKILTGSRRLFVTRQQVAEVVVEALRKDKNGDLLVGRRARLARPVILYGGPIVERSVRGEYEKLLHLAKKMESPGSG